MNISEFWIGRPVARVPSSKMERKYMSGARVGHVVGFSRNSFGEVIVRVAWETKIGNAEQMTSTIHPTNLTFDIDIDECFIQFKSFKDADDDWCLCE